MAKEYHDVDVVERTEITRAGKMEKVYRISAYTPSDVYFSIDVSLADFHKEKVHQLLTAKAAQIEGIKAL